MIGLSNFAVSNLNDLPFEMFPIVFSFLDSKSLVVSSLVSKKFAEMGKNTELWEKRKIRLTSDNRLSLSKNDFIKNIINMNNALLKLFENAEKKRNIYIQNNILIKIKEEQEKTSDYRVKIKSLLNKAIDDRNISFIDLYTQLGTFPSLHKITQINNSKIIKSILKRNSYSFLKNESGNLEISIRKRYATFDQKQSLLQTRENIAQLAIPRKDVLLADIAIYYSCADILSEN